MTEAQRTEEWFANRRGRITASCFADCMGGDKRMATYAAKVAAEILTGQTRSGYDGPATRFGKKVEPQAIAEFELRHDCDVVVPEFIVHPLFEFVGCSPDGLIADLDGLEVKSRMTSKDQMRAVMGGMPKEHMAQVQGGLWVTGRRRWWFVSYCPTLQPPQNYFEQVILPDAAYIARLETRVVETWALVQKIVSEAKTVSPF